MSRGTPSVFSTVDVEYLRSVVDHASTILEVLKHFGHSHWSARAAFFRRCETEGIDLMPLRERSRSKMQSGLVNFHPRYTLDEILCEHSPYTNRGQIKSKLIRAGLLKEVCEQCGCGPTWNGKSLVLVLDHINGINDDYRLENLRLLCPNCNSQTDTFSGRKGRYCRCGHRITRWSETGMCRVCINKEQSAVRVSRSKRPPKDDLVSLRQTMGREEVGRKFGVSGAAVKKWEQHYGLIGTLPDGRGLR